MRCLGAKRLTGALAGRLAAMGRAPAGAGRLHLGHLRVAPDELGDATEVRWPSLKRLNLYGSEPTREVLSSLVGNPSSRKLERLTIGALPDDETTLDPRVLSELLAPKGLRKLRRLTLRGLRIDADLRAILRECDSGLTDLVLRDCEVSDRPAPVGRRAERRRHRRPGSTSLTTLDAAPPPP